MRKRKRPEGPTEAARGWREAWSHERAEGESSSLVSTTTPPSESLSPGTEGGKEGESTGTREAQSLAVNKGELSTDPRRSSGCETGGSPRLLRSCCSAGEGPLVGAAVDRRRRYGSRTNIISSVVVFPWKFADSTKHTLFVFHKSKSTTEWGKKGGLIFEAPPPSSHTKKKVIQRLKSDPRPPRSWSALQPPFFS